MRCQVEYAPPTGDAEYYEARATPSLYARHAHVAVTRPPGLPCAARLLVAVMALLLLTVPPRPGSRQVRRRARHAAAAPLGEERRGATAIQSRQDACGALTACPRLLTPASQLRVYADWTVVEAYFQRGRTAITQKASVAEDAPITLTTSAPLTADVAAYPIASIWVTPDAVRKAPRVYK